LKKPLKYPLFILKIYGIIFIIILAYILIYALIDQQSGNVTPWFMVIFIWFLIGVGWVPLVIAALWGLHIDNKLKKINQSKND
jgi:Ni/Fe-hydrogenase subunit HybB-like protein